MKNKMTYEEPRLLIILMTADMLDASGEQFGNNYTDDPYSLDL